MGEEGCEKKNECDADKEDQKLKDHVRTALLFVNFGDEISRGDVGESSGGKRDENGNGALDRRGEEVGGDGSDETRERGEDVVGKRAAFFHAA